MAKPMMILLAGAACAALGAGAMAQPQTPAGENIDGRAVLFDQTNFEGRSVTIEQRSGDLRRQGFDQKARSGHFDGDWLICEAASYAGRCVLVTGDVNDLAEVGLSGRLSSLRVQTESDEARRPTYESAAPDRDRVAPPETDRAPYSASAAPDRAAAPTYAPPVYSPPTYTPPAYTPTPTSPDYAQTERPPSAAASPYADEQTAGSRGYTVVFFAHPRMNGGDVAAYDRGAADAFCRQQGLGVSVYYDTSERMLRAQEWNGAWASNAPVLRDVLCRRH